ncbi:MAG: heavy-metal-associated domain-containing protein [Cyanobacteriota bacterium]|nr:heavy-metal-associated domain-containing protein [Cyanobacteriota bacterium]
MTLQWTGDFRLNLSLLKTLFTGFMALQFHVPKLACGACVATVTQAIQKLDPQAVVQADPKTKQVIVTSQQPEGQIRQTLAAAGYPPQ